MTGALGRFELQLCDIQGRLFELTLKKQYDSAHFIFSFMNSQTASYLDREYDRLQWAGEEYILETLEDETGGLKKAGTLFDNEMMYWCGYLYRYWHFFTGEPSLEIYTQADAEIMNNAYLGFHTLDCTIAIEDLKEMHRQKSRDY